MNRIVVALLLLMTAAAPARAWTIQKATSATPTNQLFISGTTNNAANTAINYFPLDKQSTVQTAVGDFTTLAVPGTITIFEAKANGITNPTGTQSWAVTVVKCTAGSCVDTAETCTINSSSSPAGTCTITTNASFAAGDTAYIRTNPSNTPPSARFQTTANYQSTTPNEVNVSTWGSGFSTTANQVIMAFNTSVAGSGAVRHMPPFPDGGTVDHLCVSSNAPDPGVPGSSKKYDYFIEKSGSDTAVTASIAADATSNCDLTHSASVTAGQDIQIIGKPANTPAAATLGAGFRYVPSTAGAHVQTYSTINVDSATAVNYWPFNGANSGVSASETSVTARTLAMTVTKAYFFLATAPGAAASGKQRTITLRASGSDTLVSCTFVETQTTCNWSGSVVLADHDTLAWSDTPIAGGGGNPATTSMSVGILATR